MSFCLLKLSTGNFSEFDHTPEHMEDVVMLNRLDKLTPLYSSQDETHWG